MLTSEGYENSPGTRGGSWVAGGEAKGRLTPGLLPAAEEEVGGAG
jgi:hypothetical protein